MSDVRILPCPRWVRATLGGRVVIDSRDVLYVYGMSAYPGPAWFVPRKDVKADALERDSERQGSSRLGLAEVFSVKAGDRSAPDALRAWPQAGRPELAEHLSMRFDAFDQVFEEEELVYDHPRDPFHRVDALPSRRRVELWLGSTCLARSDSPVLVFETHLPVRYYLAPMDVRTDLLAPTEHRTVCPYKGFARYWSLRLGEQVHDNLVWSYPAPFPAVQAIAGRMCFYHERLDVVLDGVRLQRPDV